jgi:hypothetical protein
VDRLLQGHYSSVIAHTDSFAKPVWLSSPSAIHLVRGVCAGWYQPLLPPGSSRRCLCESFLRCLSPCPGGPLSAFAWFFLSVIGLPHLWIRSASRFCPRTRFSAVTFRGCSYFFMFRPPILLASQIVPTAAGTTAGQPRLSHPSRTYVVTFARIGHTIRLTTGNWRNEDFHLARFAALSAAHHSSVSFHSAFRGRNLRYAADTNAQ